ncbi:hypothetical protein GY12_12775 [Micrococcus luteus]|nr:hypothetical protein GY12_12775 [Micrococcus luteus]
MSPSEASTNTWWSNGEVPGAASGSISPRTRRCSYAKPTPIARPWPSGPVVTSTPWVWPYSGWPGVLDPSVRSAWMSSISSPAPAANSCRYWMSEAWPAERMKRSRPSQRSSVGSRCMTFWYSCHATGASEIAVPGWPCPAFSTASAESALSVSTIRRSCSE